MILAEYIVRGKGILFQNEPDDSLDGYLSYDPWTKNPMYILFLERENIYEGPVWEGNEKPTMSSVTILKINNNNDDYFSLLEDFLQKNGESSKTIEEAISFLENEKSVIVGEFLFRYFG